MLNFGIFRRMKDKHGELLLEFDDDEVSGRLMERMQHHLPKLPEKARFYHEKPRGWTRAEISKAFLSAWNDVVNMLKSETIRIH